MAARRTLVCLTLMALASAGPSHAQRPGHDEARAIGADLAGSLQPRDRFTITGDQDVNLLRFRGVHAVSLCVDPQARPGIAVIATWDDDTETIAPGNCFMLEARHLSVRAAVPLGGAAITGTIRALECR